MCDFFSKRINASQDQAVGSTRGPRGIYSEGVLGRLAAMDYTSSRDADAFIFQTNDLRFHHG